MGEEEEEPEAAAGQPASGVSARGGTDPSLFLPLSPLGGGNGAASATASVPSLLPLAEPTTAAAAKKRGSGGGSRRSGAASSPVERLWLLPSKGSRWTSGAARRSAADLRSATAMTVDAALAVAEEEEEG